MAKLTLSNITSGYLPIATVNANWDLIETALENTLSRDGTSPNTMGANLDMNSYDILNVDAISAASLSVNGVAVTTSTLTSASPSIVTTIANLKALAVPTSDITVIVRGYYASADGGGGVYYWNSLDTTTGNNGTVVVCTANGVAAGRFNLLFN